MIRLQGVRFFYHPAQPVLDGVDLELPPGLTLLLGPNGSGKTTLLKIAAGIERPDSGKAEIDGHDLWREEAAARRHLAYVSEQPDLTPYATIGDIVRLVCRLHGQPWTRGAGALQRVGLSGMEGRSVRELSMGQRRRAVLAAAWVGTPTVVLLDEPLEALDREMRRQMLDWVEKTLDEAAVVVVATHEIEPFISRAARALTLRAGKVRVHDPLPADIDERTRLLESLASHRG